MKPRATEYLGKALDNQPQIWMDHPDARAIHAISAEIFLAYIQFGWRWVDTQNLSPEEAEKAWIAYLAALLADA